MKKKSPKVRIKRTPTRLFISLLCLITVVLSSCQVVRTVTNESRYLQKGDTSVIIQTKTVEQYDGSKRF